MQVTAETKYLKQPDGRFVPIDPKTDKPVPRAHYICGPIRFFAGTDHDFKTYEPGETIPLPVDDDDPNSWPSYAWEAAPGDEIAAERLDYVRAKREALLAEQGSAEAQRLAAERRASEAHDKAEKLKKKADEALQKLKAVQGGDVKASVPAARPEEALTMSQLGKQDQKRR